MSTAPLMLSVSGCRGILGHSLTPEVAARFAGGFAAMLRERTVAARAKPLVVLCRDGRAGSQSVQHAAIGGLLGAGCDVIDAGIATTPTAAVLTDAVANEHRAGGTPSRLVAGMVLTASHNPQMWCGLKCLLGLTPDAFGSAAAAPPAEIAREIVDRFKAHAPYAAEWNQIGTLTRTDDAVTTHVRRVLDAVEAAGVCDEADSLGEGFTVCIDSVNASGVEASRVLMEAIGIDEFCHLGNGSDGIFPHPPEPTAENLGQSGGLADAVINTKSAVGFAQDPDADRLAIIDEKGRYIGEEYTLVLGAMAVLEAMKARGETTQGRTLATNLSTSRMLEDIAARYGCTVRRAAVGEANVVSAMKADTAIIGGEGNGGVIWPRVAYVRDSLAGMLLTLSLLKNTGKPLSAIVDSIPAYAIVKRKVDLSSPAEAATAVDKVAAVFASERLDRQDGVRVDFEKERAWLHVRGSNTEPIMRLIAEAPTQAVATRILDAAEKAIG